MVERVQSGLTIAACRLDLSASLSDREQLTAQVAASLHYQRTAKTVDQLRYSAALCEAALPCTSAESLLEINVYSL